MNRNELQSVDATFKLIAWGAVALGVGIYALTRKSEEQPPPAPAPEPLLLPTAVITRNIPIPTLDLGLSTDERAAVQKAVNHETIAANLTGFASTFEPMFPVAASVLRARAAELQNARTSGEDPCCDDCAHGDKPPCGGLPCDQKVTGPAIFAGLPKSFVGG